jgi:hypothetical protein
MATPARLVVLACPRCRATACIFHNDYGGMPGQDYRLEIGDQAGGPCSKCGCEAGLRVKQQAPPEFFLQPHDLYPMTQQEFDYWVGVLREHLPDHPKLKALGTTWYAGRRAGLRARLRAWLGW